MRNKNLTLPSILFLLAIALTACGETIAEVEAAAATTGPALENSSLASPTSPALIASATPAPLLTDTSVPQATAGNSASTASVSFVTDVMPILESRCIKCHGGESTKEGLDMKTYSSLMAGSKNGSVLTPGNANDSFLVKQLLEGEMPKRGPRLTPDQIQTFVDWINAGALDN